MLVDTPTVGQLSKSSHKRRLKTSIRRLLRLAAMNQQGDLLGCNRSITITLMVIVAF